jgi:hypothetical protein
MSLKCRCGCGQDIPVKESIINEFGELETMRRECIDEGRATDNGTPESLEGIWRRFLSSLSEEDREGLDGCDM